MTYSMLASGAGRVRLMAATCDGASGQLAERLGVNEAQVSKDESNDYHGISVERAQRIIDALEGSVTVAVSTERPSEPELELVKAH